MKKKVHELLAIVVAKNEMGLEPYWGLPKGKPTKEQVQDAIAAGKLTPWPEGGRSSPQNQGNETWHLGRIAWLMLNWREGHPIELIGDRDLDGSHRVLAAYFKGLDELEVFRKIAERHQENKTK